MAVNVGGEGSCSYPYVYQQKRSSSARLTNMTKKRP